MTSFFSKLFDTSGFPPRWSCGEWSEGHAWLHILSDIAIFGAYAAIPMALAFFISRRKDVPFVPIFWLFCLFIVSCGVTHLIEATIFWHPWYRLSGVVKAVTAAVSWMTVIALLRVLPSALALPGLARDNRHLTALIAERERAEAALRESEERFRAIADNIPQLAWLVDSERRVVWFNRVWLDYTGTTLEDNVGMGWKATLHPDHVDAMAEKFERHLREGRDWEDTFMLRGKDGRYRWFLSRMKAIRDDSGKVVRYFGTNTDITEMRRNEEALRSSEALYRAIGESINYGVWVCEPDGRNTYASASFLRLVGITQEQCSSFGWKNVLHPDEAEETIAAWQECARTGKHWDRELRFRGVDGRWHHVLARGTPVVDDSGRTVKWAGINLDISRQKRTEEALRRSEQRFRLAVGTVSNLIWTNNADGQMEGEQLAWQNFTGQSLQEYQGYGWAKSVHPEDAQATIDAWDKAVAEQGMFVHEHRLRRADGQWRLCSIRAVPMFNQEGTILEWVGVHTDITDERLADEALREREHRLQFTLDSAQIGDWDLDLVTDTARHSLRYDMAFGYTEPVEKWGFDIFSQHVHPEDRAEVMRQFAEVVREAKDWHFQCRVIWPDNSIHWIAAHGRVYQNREGRPVRFVGIVQEITALREADGMLREREALFSTIIEQSPGGVYVIDDEFRMRHVNPESREALASAAPLIGRDFTEVMHKIWGTQLGSELAAIFRHTLVTGERYISPGFTAQRHDLGLGQSYEWETQRVKLPNGRHGVVCYFADVTERRRAEDALRSSEEFKRSIIESSPDCIKVLDLDGNLLSLEAGHQLLGVADITHLLGTSWIDFWVREEDRTSARAAVAEAAAGGEGKFVGFFRTMHGLDKWWSVAVTPIRDHTSQPTRLLAVLRDVTEQRALDDALVARAEELARADRSKDEFLAMLAHELRNPLASLRNAAEILQSEETSAAERKVAQPILRRQIENMSRMIDDLLDVSRITQGKIKMNFQAVALEAVLTGAASAARANCSARGQQLEVKLPQNAVFLNADATRLEQVLSNLLNNACKYSGDGSLITLSAEVVAAAHTPPEVIIRVSDNGIGIEPELLPHIFELFVQSTRSLDRAHGGLGIGLTLVQRLVQQHGGRVEAHSGGLGGGAEFSVHLPIMLEAPKPVALASQSPMRETPRRMLIVDDNTDAARTLATLQNRRGHDTRTAFTGPDAVAAAAEFLPEVVLLDIGLPGMDGFNVARQLRAMPALTGAFIVAMSGYGREEDLAEATLAGFDEYLIKPIDLVRLSELLRNRL